MRIEVIASKLTSLTWCLVNMRVALTKVSLGILSPRISLRVQALK